MRVLRFAVRLDFDFDFMKVVAFNRSFGNILDIGFGLNNIFRHNLALVNRLNDGFGPADGFMLNLVNVSEVSIAPSDILVRELIITTIRSWY